MSKNVRVLALTTMALIFVFAYNNCSGFKPPKADFSLSSLVSENGQTVKSPFTINKLRLEVPISELSLAVSSQHLTTASLTASSNLSELQDLKLQMIADNKCLKTLSSQEISQLMGASVSFDYSKQSSKISIQSYPLTIHGSVTYSELETLSNTKPCIIGVTRNSVVQMTGSNLPAPLQNTAHLNYLKMDQALANYPADLQNSGDPVIVAVVDTGVDTDHPNLAPLIWTDKDGNRNFNFSRSTNIKDGNGHGTHVSGLALSMTDFNPKIAKIMAVKVLGDDGSGYSADVFNGIMFAIENGASVINLSLSGRNIGAPFEYIEASWRALNHNVLMVVAAGNNNERVVPLLISEDPNAPSLLNQGPWPSGLSPIAGLLNVGSIDTATGQRSSFSNYSTEGYVEISAPGCDLSSARPFNGLKSTVPGGQYNSFCGTSMASPIVAGASALLVKYYKNRNVFYTSRGLERELLDFGAKQFKTSEFNAELDPQALTQNLSGRAPASIPKENGPDLKDPYVQIVANLFTTYLLQNYTAEKLNYYVEQLKNNKKSLEWLAQQFIAQRPEGRLINAHYRSCTDLSILLHLGLTDQRVIESGYRNLCAMQNVSDSVVLHTILLSKDMFTRLDKLGLTQIPLFIMDEGKNVDGAAVSARKLIAMTIPKLLHRTTLMEDLMRFANQDPTTITEAIIAANAFISNEIFLLGLYSSILEKDVDNLQTYHRDEVLFWLNKLNTGTSRDSVRNDFLNSDEKFVIDQVKFYLGATPGYLGTVAFYFQQIQGGAMTRADVTAALLKRSGENPETAKVITAIYQKYFGRDPEKDGLNYWAIQSKSYSAIQLEAAIICGTAESEQPYVLKNTAQIARAFLTNNGFAIPNWLKATDTPNPPKNDTTAEAAIRAIYQKYFNRDADVDGLNYWLKNYSSRGAVQTEIDIIFGATGEGRTFMIQNRASEARMFLSRNNVAIPNWLNEGVITITNIYMKYFGRTPDTDGMNYWITQYSSRGPVQIEADILYGTHVSEQPYVLKNTAQLARSFLTAHGIPFPAWLQ